MELASMLTSESYTLLAILGVLMMILRGHPKVENWAIQWIILIAALILSFIQAQSFNIDVILNGFISTGVCLFGENAMYRKKSEKTIEESDMLNILCEYKNEVEVKKQCKVNMNDELKSLLKSDTKSDNIE